MDRQSEYDIRKAKVTTLTEIGVNPFSQTWKKDTNIGDLIAATSLEDLRTSDEIMASWPQSQYALAWRLMLKRVSGKLSFAQLKDETGTIQLMFEYQKTKIIEDGVTNFQWSSKEDGLPRRTSSQWPVTESSSLRGKKQSHNSMPVWIST